MTTTRQPAAEALARIVQTALEHTPTELHGLIREDEGRIYEVLRAPIKFDRDDAVATLQAKHKAGFVLTEEEAHYLRRVLWKQPKWEPLEQDLSERLEAAL